MKKLFAVVLSVLMLISLCACSTTKTKYVIGISQYAEHPSLDNCRTGFIAGLEEAGLKEGTDFEVKYQNAGADDSVNIQIAQNLVTSGCDLICAVATPAAMACFQAADGSDIPVVFTAITDPSAAGLAEGNITGTSDKLPVEAQLELIRAMQPEATVIGIIYTTSEPNSVSAIAEYEAKAGDYGFTIEAIGVTAQAEVTQAVDTLIQKQVNCLSNLTDNNVVDVLGSILEKTDEAGIPVYGSEVEQVKMGCVASAGIDYYLLGIQTGKMAAKVLKGEATCEELPFETVTDFSTYINSEAIANFGIEVPADILEKAVEANEQ